jgi:hypothetical protein
VSELLDGVYGASIDRRLPSPTVSLDYDSPPSHTIRQFSRQDCGGGGAGGTGSSPGRVALSVGGPDPKPCCPNGTSFSSWSFGNPFRSLPALDSRILSFLNRDSGFNRRWRCWYWCVEIANSEPSRSQDIFHRGLAISTCRLRWAGSVHFETPPVCWSRPTPFSRPEHLFGTVPAPIVI